MLPEREGDLLHQIALLKSDNMSMDWHVWEYKKAKEEIARLQLKLTLQNERIEHQQRLVQMLADLLKAAREGQK